MPVVSSKRQITLPVEQCNHLNIHPGDEVEIFSADGVMTIVKKRAGAAHGLLKHIRANKKISDDESLRSQLR